MKKILLLVSLFLLSCKSDNQDPDPKPSTTPYTLEIPFHFGRNYTIPSDNPLTQEGVELGRLLFYEPLLSRNNQQSCASCHKQANAFAEPRRVSMGTRGQTGTRNSMSLSNLLWVNRFFWDGRAESLEEQALDPITNPLEMDESIPNVLAKLQATDLYPSKFEAAFGNPTITAENLARALAQFQRTLISSNSKYDQFLKGSYQPTDLELEGIELFFTHPIPEIGLRGGNCGDCHVGPLVTGDPNGWLGFHNNGLDTDENLAQGLAAVTGRAADKGKFRAPSLRNIALTAPYMHDGRFAALEEVIEHYDEHINNSQTLDPLIIEASNEIVEDGKPIKLHLTDHEKRAILAFLEMLTDQTFINDPRFSDPRP
ncbi:MAG: cytochrome-c peroxidase [Bernardetiaceae bacterium]